jgi:hypothetical protein
LRHEYDLYNSVNSFIVVALARLIEFVRFARELLTPAPVNCPDRSELPVLSKTDHQSVDREGPPIDILTGTLPVKRRNSPVEASDLASTELTPEVPSLIVTTFLRQSNGSGNFARVKFTIEDAEENEVAIPDPAALKTDSGERYSIEDSIIGAAVTGLEEALEFVAKSTARCHRVLLWDIVTSSVDTNEANTKCTATLGVLEAIYGIDLKKAVVLREDEWVVPYELLADAVQVSRMSH